MIISLSNRIRKFSNAENKTNWRVRGLIANSKVVAEPVLIVSHNSLISRSISIDWYTLVSDYILYSITLASISGNTVSMINNLYIQTSIEGYADWILNPTAKIKSLEFILNIFASLLCFQHFWLVSTPCPIAATVRVSIFPFGPNRLLRALATIRFSRGSTRNSETEETR